MSSVCCSKCLIQHPKKLCSNTRNKTQQAVMWPHPPVGRVGQCNRTSNRNNTNNKKKHQTFAATYIQHFMHSIPIPSIATRILTVGSPTACMLILWLRSWQPPLPFLTSCHLAGLLASAGLANSWPKSRPTIILSCHILS